MWASMKFLPVSILMSDSSMRTVYENMQPALRLYVYVTSRDAFGSLEELKGKCFLPCFENLVFLFSCSCNVPPGLLTRGETAKLYEYIRFCSFSTKILLHYKYVKKCRNNFLLQSWIFSKITRLQFCTASKLLSTYLFLGKTN